MRLKDFSETFKEDLQDKEFILGYLKESLSEGGISLFILALRDIIEANQEQIDSDNITLKRKLFRDFLSSQDPTFSMVYEVVKALGFHFDLQEDFSEKRIA
jgi:DNA-binding phage protein